MSSQSGITASPELIDSFKEFVTSGNRALIIKIIGEDLKPVEQIKGNSTLDMDLDLINTQFLNDYEPSYLIIKHDPPSKKYIFVSFVPDLSKVKEKMLYASTKNNLLRQLGGDFFNPILFINEREEISSFGWQKMIDSENSINPLTTEERNFKNFKNNEILDVSLNSKSQTLVNDIKKNLTFKIDEDLISNLQNIKDSQLIKILIRDETLINLENLNDILASNIIQNLNTDQPSYNIAKIDDKLYFIYTCPSGSKVKDRMLYASNKQGFVSELKNLGLHMKKVIEIGDPEEIELTEFEDDENVNIKADSNDSIRGNAPNNLRFSKPKGPRRR